MNGTVAPAIARALAGEGVECIPWNRAEVPVDTEEAMHSFLGRTCPDRVLHAALGSPEWARSLARLCREQAIPFVFVSTVSVFANPPDGPYGVGAIPNAEDDYGRYKKTCEGVVRDAHPGAAIVRIGWQIGTARGSNNMIDWLEKEQESKGRIEANRNWIPSCSFLEDTAAAFARFLRDFRGGVYHIEGNATGLTFAAIVRVLNTIHGSRWAITESDGPTFDNRLAESLRDVLPIESHFTV